MKKTTQTKQPHFYNGNIKIGDMLTFNKLAGNTSFKGVKGSCGNYCSGCWEKNQWKNSPCYVAKSYSQYKDRITDSHIVNTLAMRNNTKETFELLNSQLQRKRLMKEVRIHASGELESVQEFKGWLWLAQQNPKRKFYIYTKAYDIVDNVLKEVKGKVPQNFFINISIWHEHGISLYNKYKGLTQVRAFVYDDGNFDYLGQGLKLQGYCSAYKKGDDGKIKLSHELTCDKCKLCFSNKCRVLGCYSH